MAATSAVRSVPSSGRAASPATAILSATWPTSSTELSASPAPSSAPA